MSYAYSRGNPDEAQRALHQLYDYIINIKSDIAIYSGDNGIAVWHDECEISTNELYSIVTEFVDSYTLSEQDKVLVAGYALLVFEPNRNS